jgi:hypothetical protein
MNPVPTVRGRQAGAIAIALIAALAVAGCNASTGAPSAVASALAAAPPVVLPSETPAASEPSSTPAADSSGTPLPTAVVTDIDPCQLITSDEASTFVGVKFGAGKATNADNNVKMCSYSGPGPNIFTVEVAVAPDVATAQAAEADAKATLSSRGPKLGVIPLPSFADNTDAAILQGSGSAGGISLGARALLLLKGTTFVGFSDISAGGVSPPTEQAFQDQGNAVLAKLP